MISGFVISNIEGKIESQESLANQRFPKLNINLDKVSSSNNKLKVDYTFAADYLDGDNKDAKSVGYLKLGGTIEIVESKEKVAEIMKRWDEKHSLPVDLAEEIINGLNFRCSSAGTLLAYSIGLIPPLVISMTKVQEKEQ
ncbi:MAG: hypothetical protein M1331_02045 [Candidatus Marsarchaeota archaeon]|nr:hypothetical protein [Candidatus Marsarchaeota archaeon]MCL5106157.1 hypothetical protein [Candidatus Marsarchaeota archaeon]